MTLDEFDEYAKAHDYVIFTKQQYEHVIDVFNNYELLSIDYYGRLKADKMAMLDKIRAEIGKSKTKHEMQNDIKVKSLISDIYCDIVNILNKCKAESEDT